MDPSHPFRLEMNVWAMAVQWEETNTVQRDKRAVSRPPIFRAFSVCHSRQAVPVHTDHSVPITPMDRLGLRGLSQRMRRQLLRTISAPAPHLQQ